MAKRGSLIRLADNPFGTPEEDPMGGGGDELGMPEGDGYEGEEEEEPLGAELAYKGREIHGPRMKLSIDRRLSGIEKTQSDTIEILASLAKSSAILGKAALAMLRKDGDEDEEEKEDKAVRKARTAKARVGKQFESDTTVGGDVSQEAGRGRSEEETINEPGLQDERGSVEVKGRVSKDDAASNFGEKDSDMPGNRQLVPDNKDKSPEEILIQGDASAGPGVMVSAAVKAEADAAYSAVLAKHGVIKKALSPIIGSGPAPAPANMDELFDRAKSMSFEELARWRMEVGDLSSGLI